MKTKILIASLFLFGFAACHGFVQSFAIPSEIQTEQQSPHSQKTIRSQELSRPIRLMLESAGQQTKITKSYDPNYTVLAYPNGDVPMETGVCTDVVIRAMRRAGVDLQKEVHEDMKANFSVYPKKWGLKRADSNIDHRRVPNLQTFFSRKNKALPITKDAGDYQPGDIVAWDLDGKGLTHIGVVSDAWNEVTKRYLVIHNIGRGAETEDVLFDWKLIGHYRYF